MSPIHKGKGEEKKKRRLVDVAEIEEFDRELWLRYGFLMVREMEVENRMRNKALKMARRRRRQTNGWVI